MESRLLLEVKTLSQEWSLRLDARAGLSFRWIPWVLMHPWEGALLGLDRAVPVVIYEEV